ncbi:hypothetical protein V2J09_011147 [Rumex salicifolius]
MSGTEYRFFLSCDTSLLVTFRIDRLDGNLPSLKPSNSGIGVKLYVAKKRVPRSIRTLKDKYPDHVIYTDVALDPYSSDGHDGVVREDCKYYKSSINWIS